MAGKILDDANQIKQKLKTMRVIALVGASPNWERASNQVMKFLMDLHYEVIPVNPNYADTTIHGQKVYKSLQDIPKAIDMVDVFLPAAKIPSVVDDMLDMETQPKLLWLQLGIIEKSSMKKAADAGIDVVANDCPKIHLCNPSEDDLDSPCW